MKARFFTAITQSKGVRQSFLTIFGNTLSSGVAAIALIIGSRLLGPTEFGTFSVGFSLILILSRLNEAGLNTVILKYASAAQNQQEQNALYSLVLRYKILLSIVLGAVGLVFANPLAQFMNVTDSNVIKIAFTLGLGAVYYEYLLSILQSLHAFLQGVVINLIQAGLKLISAVGLFVLNQSAAVPFFTWQAVAPWAPVVLASLFLPRWVRLQPWAHDRVLQRKIFKLAKHTSVAFIAAGIIENVDILFLQKYLSSYETGLYGGVSRIALALAVVAYSLGNVLNPRVARYKSREHLVVFLRKAVGVAALSLLGFAVFVPLAEPILWLTVGPEYTSGLTALVILAGASFLAIASMPFIALFYSFEADWYFSVSGLIQLAIVLVGNLLFVPLYGLEAAAWTRLASRIFLFVFSTGTGLWLYHRHYGRKALQ